MEPAEITVEILKETRALMEDVKEVTQDLSVSITTMNATVSNTHRALWAMADAILLSTPAAQRSEVKPHVDEIKEILDPRPGT